MAATIHLEIVTPEGLQLSEDVTALTAPSVQGEFGVLPSHRPLLAGLKTGILKFDKDGETSAVAVGPGFAKVADDVVNVLTDKFIAKADVDPVVARKDLKEAESALAELASDSSDEAKVKAVAAARWAAARLELYGDPPPPTIVMAHETRLLGHEDYGSTVEAESSQAEEARSAD